MTQTDRDTTQAFMKDFWKFFKKYMEPEGDVLFWDDVLSDAKTLMEKYNHNPVFDQTTAGFIAGIDEKWRKSTGRWKS